MKSVAALLLLISISANAENVIFRFEDGKPMLTTEVEADTTIQTQLYRSGAIQSRAWFKGRGLHRRDGPALIKYNENGAVVEEEWFLNGLWHRDGDEPASIWYYDNGQKKAEMWYSNGKRHRINGPALIEYNADSMLRAMQNWEYGKRVLNRSR